MYLGSRDTVRSMAGSKALKLWEEVLSWIVATDRGRVHTPNIFTLPAEEFWPLDALLTTLET